MTNTGDGATLGAGSLRAAINYANAHSGSTITFSAGLSGIIELGSGLPQIAAGMTIQGPGASTLAIDGYANSYRPFLINAPGAPVVISGLTIQNGSDAIDNNGGGGINIVGGTVSLVSCTLSGNNTLNNGGAVYDLNSNLLLYNCTLAGNTANNIGGAIWAQFGTLTSFGCTVSGNSAFDAAGVYVSELVGAFKNCTIVGNAATFDAGGFYDAQATCGLTCCTFSGNSAVAVGGGFVDQLGRDTFTNCITLRRYRSNFERDLFSRGRRHSVLQRHRGWLLGDQQHIYRSSSRLLGKQWRANSDHGARQRISLLCCGDFDRLATH